MIKSFRDKALARFWETGNTRGLSVQNTARVRRLLDALNAARRPGDMNVPGARFHSLGDFAPGRYSVWVSGNYRITFAWDDGAVAVDLEDYH